MAIFLLSFLSSKQQFFFMQLGTFKIGSSQSVSVRLNALKKLSLYLFVVQCLSFPPSIPFRHCCLFWSFQLFRILKVNEINWLRIVVFCYSLGVLICCYAHDAWIMYCLCRLTNNLLILFSYYYKCCLRFILNDWMFCFFLRGFLNSNSVGPFFRLLPLFIHLIYF